MFDTILIANRGEIACRVIATCRRMGVRTAAVFSDADERTRHVRLADIAVRIGPPEATESYLDIERILDAARRAGAQAIHPGYGFLSENAEFAEACARAGIVFIGPSPAAIRAMGSKAAAKELMRKAGVPLTPGYDGANQSADFLAQQADAIGYPVMIKANAGGGGKGMRRVDSREQFQEALASCRREAAAAFGDDSVLLEKYLQQPRHVEVQVFGDTHGNVVSIFERDCSVQRRHQKVIEEAPAPMLSAELRAALGDAGRSAARAVGYAGAGTVEFLVDQAGGLHFMEMNTRLQVEHPVTEMITGLDLVEWQLRVAAGEELPLRQDELQQRGHAIEARIYAEDPAHDFLPSIGRLAYLKTPDPGTHVRIDSGVEQGDAITPFYDPMIAKLIVWDETREAAVQRLLRGLAEFHVVGVANNIGFLRRLVATPSFRDLCLDTSLIEREHDRLFAAAGRHDELIFVMAAAFLVWNERQGAGDDVSPWAVRDGWRLNATHTRTIVFAEGVQKTRVQIEYHGSEYVCTLGPRSLHVRGIAGEAGRLRAEVDGILVRAEVVAQQEKLHVFRDGTHSILAIDDPLPVRPGHDAGAGNLLAPMPGRVIARVVEPGQHVEAGTALMILEAMKMECTVRAPATGCVEKFHFDVGDQVSEGAELLRFASDGEAEA